MLSELAPRLYSTVGGNIFSEVNLDISVLLSEVMGGVGDIYLRPCIRLVPLGAVFPASRLWRESCGIGILSRG